MRPRKALLLVVVVGSLLIAGCANVPGTPPTTDTQGTSIGTSPTTDPSTTASPSTRTAEPTESPTTTTQADYTRPTTHDVRIVNDLETDALVQLTILNQSNETVLEQEFTVAAESNITRNLRYDGPRGAAYTISATQDGTTVTTSAHVPWNKLIYISVTKEGIRISIMVV